ncbi:MAG: hypothetical protein C0484_16665 [Rhodospirillum sp.]|nr:hypothetical protein [Rhodospirillum sp.]
MLSRTADSLYWFSRYVERADYLARMLEAAMRLSSLPIRREDAESEWASALATAGCMADFESLYDRVSPAKVTRFLAFSKRNPTSIRNCLRIARRNARQVRTALTAEMWDTINSAWLELNRLDFDNMDASAMARFLEWVKEISLRIDGSGYRTMLRNDAYSFARLGIFLERADNTARILDVKYHVLLPENVEVGGGLDYSQWAAILRAVSALTAYHHVYHESLKPLRIADLMLLNDKMPRSLASCYRAICANLDSLAGTYGKQGEAQRLARSMRNRLDNARIEQIFESGLHEFCENAIKDNGRLGAVIAEQYLV